MDGNLPLAQASSPDGAALRRNPGDATENPDCAAGRLHPGYGIFQIRSGFATPTGTFEGRNDLPNVSDRVANPVTLPKKLTQPIVGHILRLHC